MISAEQLRKLALVLGPIAALLLGLGLRASGLSADIAVTAAVALWCVFWWIFEPVPIPATSLLPLAILPLSGVLTPSEVGAAYGSPLILLLLGGFILSRAMEHSGAHRRLAFNMMRLFGAHSDRRLVFGFMAASSLLSMWISNTATTLMLLPVALAILEKARDTLAVPLLLGMAYAASVGGLATPIGTPANLVFMQVYRNTTGIEVTFSQWMSWGLPVVLMMVPLMGLWLTRRLRGSSEIELPRSGRWRPEETRVMLVFALTALAWITRTEPFGGWRAWLDLPTANDASVALLAVVLMFIVPNGRGGRLLDWEQAVVIPWGVLLLFAGGICLAKAFVSSGLSGLLGDWLVSLSNLPLWALVLMICLVVTFLTETTSNTASTTLLMPILAAAGVAAGIAPEILMVPAAMTASCAFMLPVATAPNTVVYSSNLISVARMVREGFALNLLGVVVVASVCLWRLAG
ncbi:MAG: SLC13 family permease [Halieaceae bacterium]|nr:SLC13 family permease [Halieaceae bacterium]